MATKHIFLLTHLGFLPSDSSEIAPLVSLEWLQREQLASRLAQEHIHEGYREYDENLWQKVQEKGQLMKRDIPKRNSSNTATIYHLGKGTPRFPDGIDGIPFGELFLAKNIPTHVNARADKAFSLDTLGNILEMIAYIDEAEISGGDVQIVTSDYHEGRTRHYLQTIIERFRPDLSEINFEFHTIKPQLLEGVDPETYYAQKAEAAERSINLFESWINQVPSYGELLIRLPELHGAYSETYGENPLEIPSTLYPSLRLINNPDTSIRLIDEHLQLPPYREGQTKPLE